jgi:hypothetical protein
MTMYIDAAKLFVEETQIPMTPQEYLLIRNKLHVECFPHCKPLPGVLKLGNDSRFPLTSQFSLTNTDLLT